jgi:hypothetical protein
VIVKVKDHDFLFGKTLSEEDTKLRIDLIRTNAAIGTDSVLNHKPHATFLGRCHPARVRHRRT